MSIFLRLFQGRKFLKSIFSSYKLSKISIIWVSIFPIIQVLLFLYLEFLPTTKQRNKKIIPLKRSKVFFLSSYHCFVSPKLLFQSQTRPKFFFGEMIELNGFLVTHKIVDFGEYYQSTEILSFCNQLVIKKNTSLSISSASLSFNISSFSINFLSSSIFSIIRNFSFILKHKHF